MAAPEKNDDRAKALQDSYAKTTAWLIAEHKEEFDGHRARLLSDAGYEWQPPLTAQERAAKARAEQQERDAVALRKILDRSGPEVLDHVLQDRANAEAAASVKSTDPHS